MGGEVWSIQEVLISDSLLVNAFIQADIVPDRYISFSPQAYRLCMICHYGETVKLNGRAIRLVIL
jgi:hypothetical protein